jgi:parallel beta-helix repeat protein
MIRFNSTNGNNSATITESSTSGNYSFNKTTLIEEGQKIISTFSIKNKGQQYPGLAVIEISSDDDSVKEKKWLDEKTKVLQAGITKVISTYAARRCDRVVIVSSTKYEIYGEPGYTVDIKDYLIVNSSEGLDTQPYTDQIVLGYKSTNENIKINSQGILTLVGESAFIDVYVKNVGDNNCIRFYVEGIDAVKNEQELRLALSTHIGTIYIGADITITETGGELDISRSVTIEGNGFNITGDLRYSKGADSSVLKDINVTGNIIIDVLGGSVTIDNVTVNRNIVDPGNPYNITIISGGVNSIHLKGVTVDLLNIYGICRVCLEECVKTGTGCIMDNINMGNPSRSRLKNEYRKQADIDNMKISFKEVYRQAEEIILEAVKAEITNVDIYEPAEVILAQEELPITGDYDAVVDTVTVHGGADNTDVTVNSRGLIKNVGIQADDADTTVDTGGKIEKISVEADNSSVTTNTGGEINSVDIEGSGTRVEVDEDSRIGNVYVNGDNASITGSGEAGIELGPDVHVLPSVEGCIISGSTAEVSKSIGLNYALSLSNIDTINMAAGTYYTDTFEITRPLTVRGANYKDEEGKYITQTTIKRTQSQLIDVDSILEKVCPIIYAHNCHDVNISWITFHRDEKAGSAVLFNGEDSFNNGMVTDCKIIGIPGPPTGVVGLDLYFALADICGAQNIRFERNIIEEEILTSRYYDIGIGIDNNINNLVIVDNIIVSFIHGIYECGNSGSSEIRGNTINNCLVSIGCYEIEGINEIRENIVIGYREGIAGIQCRKTKDSLIIGNSLTSCFHGIYCYATDNVEIENNRIYNNKTGVYLYNIQGSMKNNILYNNLIGLKYNKEVAFYATHNYWGTEDITTVDIQGIVIYAPYYLDEGMTILSIPVDSITVTSEGDVDTIRVDETLQMYANILPEEATIKAVEWSVSNGTAVIKQSGELTAGAAGTVIVKAGAKDGSRVEGIKEITITE